MYRYHLFENELDKHLSVIFDYSFAHLRAHQEERAEYYYILYMYRYEEEKNTFL